MEGNYVNRNSTHREDHGFSFEEHLPWGTSSWPARNYACSFCKREFKSAQALGGHMNVHRRDRARLRSSLLSSWVNNSSDCVKPNPNPNPSPNFKPNNNQTLVLSPPPSSSSPSPNLSDEILNCAHLSPLYNSPCLTLSSSTSGDKKPRLTTSPHLLIPLVSTPQSMDHVNYMSMNHTRSAFIGVDDDKELKCCDEHNKALKSSEHNITLELGIGLLEHQEEKLDLELRLGH